MKPQRPETYNRYSRQMKHQRPETAVTANQMMLPTNPLPERHETARFINRSQSKSISNAYSFFLESAPKADTMILFRENQIEKFAAKNR
jgi:hypothetical protein